MTHENDSSKRVNPYEFRGTLESTGTVPWSGINTALIILLCIICASQLLPVCKMPGFFSGGTQKNNCPVFLFNIGMPLGLLAALDTYTNTRNPGVLPQLLLCGAYFLTLLTFFSYLIIWFIRKTLPQEINLLLLVLANAGWFFVLRNEPSNPWRYGIYVQTTLLSIFSVLSYYRLILMRRNR